MIGGIVLERIKLFCLPYAGGSAMIYKSWKRYLDSRIDLRPVELAGRGLRFKEPLYSNAEEAVNDLCNNIIEQLDEEPFAFFGHSMGTILTYELVQKVIAQTKKVPLHVFFSGRYPPFVDVKNEKIHMLPDKEFLAELKHLGGMDNEVLENKEILELFLPILRSDYKLVDTYRHNGSIAKFNCDITVLNGNSDKYIEGKEVNRWRECTINNCWFYEFDDGHFFINKYKEEVAAVINKMLLNS